jgi:2-haloacid dehalogenase
MQAFLDEIKFMEWNALQDKGRPFEEGIADLSAQYPHRAELIQAYHDHWQDSIGDAIMGTVEILKRLKDRGWPLYGLSNWSSQTFPHALAKYDFFHLFDDMIISGQVGIAKPDAAVYRLLLERIGRSAEECLFIDDSQVNIRQADQIGFVTIHFRSPAQLEAELIRLNIL